MELALAEKSALGCPEDGEEANPCFFACLPIMLGECVYVRVCAPDQLTAGLEPGLQCAQRLPPGYLRHCDFC